MFARRLLLTSALLVACGDDPPQVERDPNPAQAQEAGVADTGIALPDARVLPADSGIVSPRDAEVDANRGKPNEVPYPACGGLAGLRCPEGEFCNHETDGLGCGWADSLGSCAKKTATCTESEQICGCDGKTYESACAAHEAGVSVKERSPCKADRETNCDERDAMCKRARPICPEGQVAEVVDQCWGACVAIAECVCHAADDCPEREKFVCHMNKQRCDYYVN